MKEGSNSTFSAAKIKVAAEDMNSAVTECATTIETEIESLRTIASIVASEDSNLSSTCSTQADTIKTIIEKLTQFTEKLKEKLSEYATDTISNEEKASTGIDSDTTEANQAHDKISSIEF